MTTKSKERPGQIEPSDIEHVMEVAGRLFAERGYDGVGVRLIAKESGITMPSIFYHFGSKPALYEEVLEYKYNQISKTILRAIDALDDPVQKLECIIGAFFDLLLRDRTFLLLMHRDIVDVIASKRRPRFSEEYSIVYSLFCTLLEAALGHAVEKRVAFPLVSLIQGFCELTAMTSENSATKPDADWYAQRRAELIDAGKRICSL